MGNLIILTLEKRNWVLASVSALLQVRTIKSWSWDLTPGVLSKFGEGHFGSADLDWHPVQRTWTRGRQCGRVRTLGERAARKTSPPTPQASQRLDVTFREHPKHQKLPNVWMDTECQCHWVFRVLVSTGRQEKHPFIFVALERSVL